MEFASGVNVIIGSSDSGKSAIIRTLRWVVWNRPSGDALQSTWGGQTSVELEIEEGIIVRIKDKKDYYKLYGGSDADLDFKAIGTGVPEEVSRILNINEINLQYQLDSPFLLSNTPGEVATHFNKVARLDKIDQGTSNVNSWVRELETTIGHEATKDKPATGLIKQIQDLEEQLKAFDYLDKMEVEVEVLEELDKQYTTLIQREAKLENLVVNIKDNRAEIRELEPLLALEEQVDKLIWQDGQRQDIQWNRDNLDTLLEHIREDTIDLKNLKWVMSFETSVNNLLQLQEELNIAVERKRSVFKLLSNINSITTTLRVDNASINAMQAKFDKEMGSVCKLCGQPIKIKYIPSRLHEDDEVGHIKT
jgi:exonuclease SbcC